MLDSYFGWFSGWPLLLLAPLVFGVLTMVERLRQRRLQQALGRRWSRLASHVCPGVRHGQRLLFACAVLMMTFALLQPRFGAPRHGAARGVDLVICLDVSRSMLARDLMPDRLARARLEIQALLSVLRGDRIGLVAFAGEARLVVPLTDDPRSFAALLARTDVLSVARGGTDLGAALAKAGQALQGASGPAAVLLLTDGEDHQGQGERAARLLAGRDIVVHTVGFGSERGAKIPLQGAKGETFLKDQDGHDVVSALDRQSLVRLAFAGGGQYVDAAALSAPLVELFERRILPMAKTQFAAEAGSNRPGRFQWPLTLALLCLLAEGLVRKRRRS